MLGLIGLLGLAVASVFLEISPSDGGHDDDQDADPTAPQHGEDTEGADTGGLTDTAGIPGIEDFLNLQNGPTADPTADQTDPHAADHGAGPAQQPLDPTDPAVGGQTSGTDALAPLDPSVPAAPPGDTGASSVNEPLDPSLPAEPVPDPGATGPAELPLDPAAPAVPDHDAAATGPADQPLDPALPAEPGQDAGAGAVVEPLPPDTPQSFASPYGDSLTGAAGTDAIAGTDGTDTVDGGAGQDTLTGGAGNDDLQGGDGNDTLTGGVGDDSLAGHAGDDSLDGGEGNDTLLGGEGSDTLLGGAGNDQLLGHSADDSLYGGPGQDTLMGGDGNDMLSGVDPHMQDHDPQARTTDDTNYLDGGAGDDRIVAGAGDHVSGGDGADTIVAGDWIATGDAATIHDFDPAHDRIEVQYDPVTHPDPHLSIDPGPQPGAVYVTLDGERLLQVMNADGLTPESVDLVRMTG